MNCEPRGEHTGGQTRNEVPLAFWLRSGDVVVMGGTSRLCYHGVPAVFGGTFTTCCPARHGSSRTSGGTGSGHTHQRSVAVGGLCAPSASARCGNAAQNDVGAEREDDAAAVTHYLSMARINANVRQVYAAPHSPQRNMQTSDGCR